MSKMLVLQSKRAGLTTEEFSRHWRTVHADLARDITGLIRYAQSHRMATENPWRLHPFQPAAYAGVSEAWFASGDGALAMTSDPTYLHGAAADEPNFTDVDKKVRLFVRERVVAPRVDLAQGAVKALFFVRSARGGRLDDAVGHLTSVSGTTGSMSMACVENLVDRVVAPLGVKFDAVVELWWDSESSARRDLSQGATRRALDRASSLLDPRSIAMLAREVRVIWPPEPPECVLTR